MRRLIGFAALVLLGSSAEAQDTTAVVVRHIPAQQDTGVVVRHIESAPARRAVPRYAASRYTAGSAVLAKDPNAATMFSLFFPGGGQYYAGAEGKGVAITLLAIGAPIIGYANVTRRHYYDTVIYNNGSSTQQPITGSRDRYDWTPAAIGLGVGITAWLYGVATAGTDVQRWNQAHGVRFMTAPGRAGFAVALP